MVSYVFSPSKAVLFKKGGASSRISAVVRLVCSLSVLCFDYAYLLRKAAAVEIVHSHKVA
jgi:hypothetical protein